MFKKILKQLLKIRTVIKVILWPQGTQKPEKRNAGSDLYKIHHFSETAVIFFYNLPLLGGVLHNNVVWSDFSLSTAHSEPHTSILEFCGSNPVPVTVMIWPPPKLPSEDIEEKTKSMYLSLF